MKNSKRGNYMMEAAVVLPLVVMAILTVTVILLFFYAVVQERSEMHIALRTAAGTVTGKTLCLEEAPWTGETSVQKSTFGGKVYGRSGVDMISSGLLREKASKSLEGTYYASDGPKYVRYCNLAMNQVNDGQ